MFFGGGRRSGCGCFLGVLRVVFGFFGGWGLFFVFTGYGLLCSSELLRTAAFIVICSQSNTSPTNIQDGRMYLKRHIPFLHLIPYPPRVLYLAKIYRN